MLDLLLAPEVPGAEALRQQVRDALATAGCTCGCGSIALLPPQGASPAAADQIWPVEAEIRDRDGEPIGGIMLWLDRGLLSSLEVYTWGDDPMPVPAIDHLVRT